MTESQFDAVQDLMRDQKWSPAIVLLREFVKKNGGAAHAWYLLGQCYRFTNDLPNSINCLNKATMLDQNAESYFLALGIAHQLFGHYEDSLAALRVATNIDPDYVEGLMSAAMTLKRMGNLAKSTEIYDEAANALARQCLKQTPNQRSTRIFGFRPVQGALWNDYVIAAALFDAAHCDIDDLAFPTGESADQEYRTRSHGGLFWEDKVSGDNKNIRLLYPNLFDSVREFFIADKRYSVIIGNKGLVLHALNQKDDADLHLEEAEEFQQLN